MFADIQAETVQSGHFAARRLGTVYHVRDRCILTE